MNKKIVSLKTSQHLITETPSQEHLINKSIKAFLTAFSPEMIKTFYSEHILAKTIFSSLDSLCLFNMKSYPKLKALIANSAAYNFCIKYYAAQKNNITDSVGGKAQDKINRIIKTFQS